MKAILLLLLAGLTATAQPPAPFDNYPEAKPPYYRVRYEASEKPGELIFGVKYAVWIPEGVKQLRGVIVHQHGCGEGSCKSGLTGAWDLHWQALAKKHDCALLSPSYEQPQKANCQMWCDPRNGSAKTFQRALVDLGKLSGHPELATVPWALWGHSGGGHWAGGMTLLHPERVAATWLRSGVPLFEANPDRTQIKPYGAIPMAFLEVPIMCNPGTKEGVTVKDGKFKNVWPANQKFLTKLREMNAPVGVAIDPLAAHECGHQRYFAIPWFDAMLAARLTTKAEGDLRKLSRKDTHLAPFLGKKAVPAADFKGDIHRSTWLPNAEIAKLWQHYVTDTEVPDSTPPPAPTHIKVSGKVITWKAVADLESGLSHFEIHRDGKLLAEVKGPKQKFGRPLFQGQQYSDTPEFPLTRMRFEDKTAAGKHQYQVIAVNTLGLKSK